MYRVSFHSLALFLCFVPLSALAAPWGADVGNAQLRSDIELLASAHVIDAITQQWPLPWSSMLERLQAPEALKEQPNSVRNAATRLLRRIREETADKAQISLDVDLASEPDFIRTYDAMGRSRAQAQAIFDYVADRTTLHLALGAQSTSRRDHQTLLVDGSYMAQRLGDVSLYAGYVTHWWGPGWSTTLSLSNNARPFPQIGVSRINTEPFATPWLSWLGPWHAEFFVGVLDGRRAAMNTLFNGLRVSASPLPGLEIGLSRTEQLCGTGHPCKPIAEFFNVYNDPQRLSQSKDETDLDLRYTDNFRGLPYAIYMQVMDRDTGPFVHSSSNHLFGASLWLPLGETPLRLTAEYANTISTVNIFDFGNYILGETYTDYKYIDGWQYRGQTLGASVDTDSRLTSLQASWTAPNAISYSFTYNHASLGSLFPAANIVTTTPVAINLGEFKVSLPFDRFRLDVAARAQDDQPRPDHGAKFSVETRVRIAI